jgi:hypothetical protein
MPVISARDTTNNKNRVLALDGDKLRVVDSAVAAALAGSLTVDGSGSTQPISAASLPLPSGAATSALQGTANGHLSDLAGCVGAAKVSVAIASDAVGVATSALQGTANTSLAAIQSSLAGTLVTSQGVSRSNAALKSAASVSSGDTTSAIDANAHRKIAIYGSSSDNAQQLVIQVSDDSSSWYETDIQVWANSTTGDYYHVFEACARYYRVKYSSTATETTKYTLLA